MFLRARSLVVPALVALALFLAAAPTLATPFPLGAPCVEVEPNHTSVSAATPLALPGSCTGSTGATQDADSPYYIVYGGSVQRTIQDMFRVDLGTSARLDVTLTFANDSANLDLFLVKPDGQTITQVLAFSVGSTTTEHILSNTLAAGQYLLCIVAVSGSTSYTISASQVGGLTAPAAPSGLVATAASSTSINLTWADNSSNEAEFRIERKTGGGAFADIGSAGAGATSFTSTGLDPSTGYTFRVRARNGAGDSAYSNEASATTLPNVTLCTPSDTTLCLNGDRWRIQANWQTEAGTSGVAHVEKITDDTGYLWFFADTNVEVVVKVLNACFAPFNNYWVFGGGLTDVKVDLLVTDMKTGASQVYQNPQKTPFQPIQDTAHFKSSCP